MLHPGRDSDSGRQSHYSELAGKSESLPMHSRLYSKPGCCCAPATVRCANRCSQTPSCSIAADYGVTAAG